LREAFNGIFRETGGVELTNDGEAATMKIWRYFDEVASVFIVRLLASGQGE